LGLAVEAPELRLSELALLSEPERAQVLREWNDTGTPSSELCLHELFEQQAERRPGAVAITWRGEDLSYSELESRANRLANRLRALGVVPEVRVGVFLERSPDLVVTLLAILKAGGAYVPLDPAYPAERLRVIL